LGQLMTFQIATRLENRCRHCSFCEAHISCPGIRECVGCGTCVDACPNVARVLQKVPQERPIIKLLVDGETFEIPSRITVLRTLELLGYKASRLPDGSGIFAPCRTGGCWACAVVVDGELKPSCVTPVSEHATIQTKRDAVEGLVPLRRVSGFQGHAVGGVGTPHWLKPNRWFGRYIEAACFAHGCILRCPTCQNWQVTYSSSASPLTPAEAARVMTRARREFGVDRMAISGGECTLNRRWLIQYLTELRRLNRDDAARLHVDTNAVILTPDYIDELVEAGMTDIGPDVKGLTTSTFMRITNVHDASLASRLLETEWKAVRYLVDRYFGRIFIGVGIPYNPSLISLQEIHRIGLKLANIEPSLQVCALDYRPEFRRQDIKKPSFSEMVEVKRVLEDAGLRCVICQTERGHIGPRKTG